VCACEFMCLCVCDDHRLRQNIYTCPFCLRVFERLSTPFCSRALSAFSLARALSFYLLACLHWQSLSRTSSFQANTCSFYFYRMRALSDTHKHAYLAARPKTRGFLIYICIFIISRVSPFFIFPLLSPPLLSPSLLRALILSPSHRPLSPFSHSHCLSSCVSLCACSKRGRCICWHACNADAHHDAGHGEDILRPEVQGQNVRVCSGTHVVRFHHDGCCGGLPVCDARGNAGHLRGCKGRQRPRQRRQEEAAIKCESVCEAPHSQSKSPFGWISASRQTGEGRGKSNAAARDSSRTIYLWGERVYV